MTHDDWGPLSGVPAAYLATFVLLCFVGSRIFGLVFFKLHSTGRYSCITAPQLHFYSQHYWTRLVNIQTNTQARLDEITQARLD